MNLVRQTTVFCGTLVYSTVDCGLTITYTLESTIHIRDKARYLLCPPPLEGCEVLWWVFVCQSVCPLAYLEIHTAELQQILLCMLPAAVARSFSDGVAINYVLPVLWMTSYFHVMAYGTSCAFLSGDRSTTSILGEFPTKFRSTIKTGSTHCKLRTEGKSAIHGFLVEFWLICNRALDWEKLETEL